MAGEDNPWAGRDANPWADRDANPWADREAYSQPPYAQPEPTRDFFVPYAKDPEAFWSRVSAGRAGARRVYSLTHSHGDQKVEATVGRRRRIFERKKDRRGHEIPSLDFDRRGRTEGSTVVAIVDRGGVIDVWSVAMSHRWANPAAVNPADVLSLEYFKPWEA
jgi:hypothetical protein